MNMIRLLIIGLGVAFLTLGWLLLSESGKEHSRAAKPSSESIAKSDASIIPASQEVPSWKSPVSKARTTAPSPSSREPAALISGAPSATMKSPVSSPKPSGNSSAAMLFGQNTGSSKNSYSQSAKDFSGVGGGGAPREISIPVPEGAKVPAVFFDVEEKPIAQQKALDRIAQEFEKNVSEIPPGLTKEDVWEAARSIADERYLTLFGYQAFNQYHIESAKEALKEKRARSNARNP
jgi:hypothetical protein